MFPKLYKLGMRFWQAFTPVNADGNIIGGASAPTKSELVNDNGNPLSIDLITRAQVGIDYAHHEIHAGSSYTATLNDNDLDNGDTMSVSFKTPDTAKYFHMVAIMSNTSSSLAEILEAPTVTNGSGVEIPCINRNRNSDKVSGALSIEATPVESEVSTNATITADGTAIYSEYIGVGKEKGTSDTRSLSEFILKQNTIYSFRITGEADNGNASIILDWYEHTDKTD